MTAARRRLLGGLFGLVLACGLGGGVAWAYWSAGSASGGHGAAVSGSVNQGATPVAVASGTSVTVSWAASSLSNGGAVSGYLVKRYDVGTLTSQPVLSACAGTVTALNCTEGNVPEGHWVYAIAPVFATNWRGPESLKSTAVWVDTTPPVNAITLSGSTGASAKSGDTVYYRGAAAGSFALSNAVSDAASGPAGSTTSTLTGSVGGWSHTPSAVSAPTGGPYLSAPFSWTAGTSSSPDEVVTGRDASGNSAATTLSFVDDSTGPTGGSVTATGLGGTGSAYAASTTVSLTLAKGSDPRGLAATGAVLQRATASLTSDGTSDGVCGPFGSYTFVATDPVSSTTNLVTDGFCYRYQYVVSDTFGNATTYTSGDVKVDLTAPAAPGRSFGSFNNTYWNGVSGLVYYRSTAPSGSFTVTASATDLASGIVSYTFPTGAAFGSNWSASPVDVDEMTYSWSGTPSTVTAKSITATNNAFKTSLASATFTPTVDNTAPAAGSVSYLNGASPSTSLSVTFTTGTDSGSGLAARLLQRASATLTGGTCGTFSAYTTIATNPAASPYVDTVAQGNCYMYQYDTPDNVGNARLNTSASVARISSDVSGPTGGSITATGLLGTGATYSTSTTVSLALDKGSDVSGTATTGNLVRRATAVLSSPGTPDGACAGFGSFSTIATDPASPYSNTGLVSGNCYRYEYVVLDSLGNATTYTSGDVKVDTSVPSTPTKSFGSLSNAYWDGVSAFVYYRSSAATGSFTVTASATDGQSGIASYAFPTAAAFGSNWSATPGALGVMTYSWSGTPAAVTAKSITATNNANLTSAPSTTFTPTADVTAPTGGTVTYPHNGTPSTTVNVTLGTVTDAGSGVASRLLQRASATLTNGICGTFTGFSTIATNPVSTTYTDSTLSMNTCYQYQYVVTDNLGNTTTGTSGNVVKVSSDVAGPTGGSLTATGLVGTNSVYSTVASVSLSSSTGTDPSGVAAGSLLQRAQASLLSTGGADGVCGAFGNFTTVTGGIDPVSPLANAATTASCWRYQYVVADNLGNTTTYTSVDVKVDTTAPTTAPSRTFGSFSNVYWDGASTSLYYRSTAATGSFTVTASGGVDGQSGISGFTFPAYGTNWTSTPGGPGVNTYSWSGAPLAPGARSVSAVNNAGLSTASATFTPTADVTAPTGGTVTYPHNGTQSTTVNVTLGTVTDAGSGVASRLLQRASATLTNGICGTFTGFSTIATNPVSTTYTDSTLSMNTCYQYQYVVTDNLGNTTTGTSGNVVKVSSDVTGPTGGSATLTGLVGTGAAYDSVSPVNLTLVKGTDPSGVATSGNLLNRASAALLSSDGTSDGVCGAFGSYTLAATDPASSTTNVVVGGFCYRYQYVVADSVGNTTTYTSGDVKVDTTAPAAPSLSFGSFSNTWWDGVSAFVYYRAAAPTGSFTVTASSTDFDSGIASYTFPAAFGTNWTATPGALGVMTYSWSGAPAAVTAKTISATNNATKASGASAAFTPTNDVTAPGAGSVTYPDTTTASTSVNVGFTTGTDSGSGVGTRLLQRASAPYSGTCGAFTSFSTIATNPPASSYNDTVPSTSTCYMYQYVVSDNVGNQTTATSVNVVRVGP